MQTSYDTLMRRQIQSIGLTDSSDHSCGSMFLQFPLALAPSSSKSLVATVWRLVDAVSGHVDVTSLSELRVRNSALGGSFLRFS